MPDYLFKDHKPSAVRGKACLRATRTPTVTLSTIGYGLSAIGYAKPSAMECEARLRGRERNNYSTTIMPARAQPDSLPAHLDVH